MQPPPDQRNRLQFQNEAESFFNPGHNGRCQGGLAELYNPLFVNSCDLITQSIGTMFQSSLRRPDRHCERKPAPGFSAGKKHDNNTRVQFMFEEILLHYDASVILPEFRSNSRGHIDQVDLASFHSLKIMVKWKK